VVGKLVACSSVAAGLVDVGETWLWKRSSWATKVNVSQLKLLGRLMQTTRQGGMLRFKVQALLEITANDEMNRRVVHSSWTGANADRATSLLDNPGYFVQFLLSLTHADNERAQNQS